MKKQLLAIALFVGASAQAQMIHVSLSGPTYTQNFDSLAKTGANDKNNIMPYGWSFYKAGDPTYVDGMYLVKLGTNEPDIFSLGDDVSLTSNITNPNPNDRSLCAQNDNTFLPYAIFGAKFKNADPDSAINGMQISFKGETWYSQNFQTFDTLVLKYSIDADSVGDTSATWTRLKPADYVSAVGLDTQNLAPDNYNGNAAANSDIVNVTITGMAIPANTEFFLIWEPKRSVAVKSNVAGIDDLSITFQFGSATIDTTDTTDTTNIVNVVNKNPLNATLYPNPATDLVHLEVNGAAADVKYFVMNTLGQRMLEGIIERRGQSVLKRTVDVKSLPAGVYYIYLEAEDGSLRTLRFIRQ